MFTIHKKYIFFTGQHNRQLSRSISNIMCKSKNIYIAHVRFDRDQRVYQQVNASRRRGLRNVKVPFEVTQIVFGVYNLYIQSVYNLYIQSRRSVPNFL